MRILELLKRFRLRAFDRSDYLEEGSRTVESPDAWAATRVAGPVVSHPSGPPDYVKTYDEDRPRH